MIFLQVPIAIGLLFVSLLLIIMVRQIGLIAQRMQKFEDGDEIGPLEPGTTIPVHEFATYDFKETVQFLPGMRGGSILMFASFTCPACKKLLRGLSDCPQDARDRLILFMLDRDIERRFTKLVSKLRLQDFPIIEALDLSSQFRIRRAPLAYVVDGTGNVLETTALGSTDDLVALTRKHFAITNPKKEDIRVRRKLASELGGQVRSQISDSDVSKAVTP